VAKEVGALGCSVTKSVVCPLLEFCEEHDKVSDSWRRNYCYTDATYQLCKHFKKVVRIG
jgi:hypothetical protein